MAESRLLELYNGNIYGDLAVLPDKTISCLYETNKGNSLYVARFNLEWLTDGKDKF